MKTIETNTEFPFFKPVLRWRKSWALRLGILLGIHVLLVPTLSSQSTYEPYTFITLAGNAGYGSLDGTGSSARFFLPSSVTVDSAGNVYVADTVNSTIRKVTPAGVVTTLAGLAGNVGSADGTGSSARFNWPSGVAADSGGNVYVADTRNNTIRKVTPAGVVTTLAGLAAQYDNAGNLVAGGSGSLDATGSAARFAGPQGLAVDSAGNIYVGDTGNSTIRKVTPGGEVTTLAGLAAQYDNAGNLVAGGSGTADGTGSAARFAGPVGVTVDSTGHVYVADTQNNTIRKITAAGVVTTLAGLPAQVQMDANGNPFPGSDDGTGSAARFWNPQGAAVDSAGNVFVADAYNNTIRKVTPAGGVTTLAGLAGSKGAADGAGNAARFWYPFGVAVDIAGNVYVADSDERQHFTIRKVTPAGVVTTLAGLAGSIGSADGLGSTARFAGPSGVGVDSAGNVYVADSDNNTIRKVTPQGEVTTLAGLPQFDKNGNFVAGSRGSKDGTGSTARFAFPYGLALDDAGTLYVADGANNTIRKVTPDGVVTTLAGSALDGPGSADGTGSAARFNFPNGVALDSAGNIYVSDGKNNTIRKVTPAGVVTTLAGLAEFDANGNPVGGNIDGTGKDARFNYPYGVAVDSAGNVYVADLFNDSIRKVTSAGVVTTLRRSAVPTSGARGLAVDNAGNVYVADTTNQRILKVTPAEVVTTIGGSILHGSIDGTGSAARFSSPVAVTVDSAGNVYVAEAGNNTIRKGIPPRSIPAPRLLPPSMSGHQFGFAITGLPGLAVDIESSIDLSEWKAAGTLVLESGTNSVAGSTQAQGIRVFRFRAR
jgi:streptogramin lyase